MNPIIRKYVKTHLGELVLGAFHEQLCLCDWRCRNRRDAIDRRLQEGLDASFEDGENAVIQNAWWQLEEYLAGKRTVFDIPLLMIGTTFQKRVWNELLNIPFGRTQTYLGLSRRLGDEKAIRSVAAANGANALAIFVPCHRIIGSDGKLTGYGGGLKAKRELLRLEKVWEDPDQPQLFNESSEA